MDQTILVSKGRRLIGLLDAEGMRPRAALWSYDSHVDSWRLWIVAGEPILDKHDFYRRISKVLRSAPDLELSTSDVQLVPGSHPAIQSLARTAKLFGSTDTTISNNLLDGFFMEEGIVLRMEPSLDVRGSTAA